MTHFIKANLQFSMESIVEKLVRFHMDNNDEISNEPTGRSLEQLENDAIKKITDALDQFTAQSFINQYITLAIEYAEEEINEFDFSYPTEDLFHSTFREMGLDYATCNTLLTLEEMSFQFTRCNMVELQHLQERIKETIESRKTPHHKGA